MGFVYSFVCTTHIYIIYIYIFVCIYKQFVCISKIIFTGSCCQKRCSLHIHIINIYRSCYWHLFY